MRLLGSWLIPALDSEGRLRPLRVAPGRGRTPLIFITKVTAAAGALLSDEHYGEAVKAAFQAFEHEVQCRIGDRFTFGQKLMTKAFGGDTPEILLNHLDSQSDQDEREGFKFLAMGAMYAFRNTLSHGPQRMMSRSDALECLGLASYLFRRLEQAPDDTEAGG